MTPDHAGREAIALVRAALDVPEERLREAVPEERAHANDAGFAWRPNAFEQLVRVLATHDDGACIVEASVPLLHRVVGRAAELAVLASWNAREPGLSSLRWDSTNGDVSLRAAVIARPRDGAIAARRLAHAALLQLGEASRAADALALAFPEAALAEPRGADARPAVPQVEAWRAYANASEDAAQDLVEKVARLASRTDAPWTRATRAAHGVDAEIACPAPGAAGGEGVALLRVSATQPHPRLGHGVVLVMVPPAGAEPIAERAPATVALLQEAEAREWTGVDAVGGWCVHPSAGLSHVVFVPALAVEGETVESLAEQAVLRARWTMAFLADVQARREHAAAPPANER